jgi:hypothetical protein
MVYDIYEPVSHFMSAKCKICMTGDAFKFCGIYQLTGGDICIVSIQPPLLWCIGCKSQ